MSSTTDPASLKLSNEHRGVPTLDPGQLVEALLKTASDRSLAERLAEQARENFLKQSQTEFQKAQSLAENSYTIETLRIAAELKKQLEAVQLQQSQEKIASETSFEQAMMVLKKGVGSIMMNAEKLKDETIWHASTNSDSKKNSVETEFNALRRHKNEMSARLEMLADRWQAYRIDWPDEADYSVSEAINQVPRMIGEMPIPPDLNDLDTELKSLETIGRKLDRFLPRKLFSIPMIFVWLASGAGLALAMKASLPICVGVFGLIGIAGHLMASKVFKKRCELAIHVWLDLNAKLQLHDYLIDQWRENSRAMIQETLDALSKKAVNEANRESRLAQMNAESKASELRTDLEEKIRALALWLESKRKDIHKAAEDQMDSQNRRIQEKVDENKSVLESKKLEAANTYQSAWQKIREQWAVSSSEADQAISAWQNWSNVYAPGWSQFASIGQQAVSAGALKLAEVRVEVESIADLNSVDADVRKRLPDLSNLPLVRFMPGKKSTVWVQAPPGRRPEMAQLLQNIAIRALSAFPPGQLRFTLIDPIGLGQTFAGLLHLADFEPALVNQRPWTEARDIEARLAELTTHLEFIVQNYLRNQYATIEDYNRDAGEVAEAYRLLILADWPHGTTDESARRLRRLIEAGARCGIYVVIGHDLSQPGPIDPNHSEIRPMIDRILWSSDKDRWSWPANPLDRFNVTWETPPDPQTLTNLVRTVGEKAKTALRVEVPFSVVAPPAGQIWTQSSARGVEIPLGRAGARHLQALRLGEGTSQHVLLAGRTGSGKSTLLHAIVTNAALRYSPNELELYLIDFKKGVEFKNYATRELPHARVVAVESEREFGLSVLERLDRELTERGERFRRAGVQDVAGFRVAKPAEPLPRILLVVDEFQELFNEDDRLSTDAASLLDRLVRQGRAFGVHAILGSQSMAGAYAIARSTMGQMGVRIALQCNENDSRLILSEDNPAARMLSRPGEAIYNDANGLVEGNHLFQAVWISDKDRETQLAAIHAQAVAQGWQRPEPMIVFEGRAAGDLSRNKAISHALNPVMVGEETLPAATYPTIWLGESVTISDPPAIVMERQPSANLMIVGRQSQEIRPMLAAALLGVAVSSPKALVRIVESPAAGEASLKALVEGLPLDIQFFEPAKLKAELTGLWETLHLRQDDPTKAVEPVLFVVSDIARLRDLRKSDDDYGFGGFGSSSPAPPSATKMLAEILRDGPSVGIHTFLWTDGSISLQHSTERSALNEFGTIVMFQTTAGESTHFLDNVSASKLDRTQALLVRPSEGESLKIRPYGKVEDQVWKDWMGRIKT